MRRIFLWLLVLGVAGVAGGLFLTAPRLKASVAAADLTGDPAAGEAVFWATGCASCHMAPGATGEAQRVLAGGMAFPSAFGTFYAPNISADTQHGIGGWTQAELAGAVMDGVGRGGAHLYPALPYNAYNKMAPQDMADLYAYMTTLPADPTPSKPHEVAFPFNIRASLGGWKLLFQRQSWVLETADTPHMERGRYIVEALAHCGECHTPRNALGGLDRSRWLAGGPNPDGKGTVPDITPGTLTWTEDEIVEYLTSGFTPEYDSVGGHMAHVVENMARMPDSDRAAVAAYLKAIPAVTP
ncbi:MAG: c-type cytochrome [Paracoccaceae bacterium]